MRSRLTLALAAAVSFSGVLWAQVPTVPTDHFGPPTDCVGVHTSAHRRSASAAEAEQREGESQSWLGLTRTLPSHEPVENIAISRMRVADYADCVGDSGCYWSELDEQYRRAQDALSVAAKTAHPGEKLAVVMDIDETTLSGYCEIKREDFGYIGASYEAWIVSPESAVTIPGAKRFFDQAKKLGVAVFFITGRSGEQEPGKPSSRENQTAATIRNLKAAGFGGYTGLALRNGDENGLSTIAYKSRERAKIAGRGYRIVMSVGDQWSDLLGEPRAETSVKLPNPFYFLP
ncbi:MAG: HAD family acid phosphatase [Acidobacteriaceae bacterium]|nr:HAD family acid phosphatase [Acidobacteriaceae bacterium]